MVLLVILPFLLDTGLADAGALSLAVASFQACHFIGLPECEVSQVVGRGSVCFQTIPYLFGAVFVLNFFVKFLC